MLSQVSHLRVALFFVFYFPLQTFFFPFFLFSRHHPTLGLCSLSVSSLTLCLSLLPALVLPLLFSLSLFLFVFLSPWLSLSGVAFTQNAGLRV